MPDLLKHDPEVDIQAARALVSALCKGDKWRMSIPVQADDSDMLLTRILSGYEAAIKQIEDLTKSHGYGSPAEHLVRLVETEVKRLSQPEEQPVYGPRAAGIIAAQKGADVLRAMQEQRTKEATHE